MKQIITGIFLSLLLTVSHAQIFEIPENGDDVVGEVFTISAYPGDTLQQIGQDFGIGYKEMLLANPHQKNYISKRTEVTIPDQYILPPEQYREGIVINTAEPRLYYFTPDGEYVFTAAIAVGRSGWRTPLMETQITAKQTRPTWRPPASIRNSHYNKTGEHLPEIIEPGPENPLGNYAIYLAKPRILIHGTNNENSIGKYASSGCIRLFNDDIQTLFRLVSRGEPVTVIHHATKIGKLNHDWLIETHPEIISEGSKYSNYDGIDLIVNDAINAININNNFTPSYYQFNDFEIEDGIPIRIY